MIDQMRSEYSITELCEAMNLSKSGYYKWRCQDKSPRTKANEILLEEIKKINQDEHLRTYGSPRMAQELKNRGHCCSENRVARLMAQQGISARHHQRWKPRTTKQNPKSNLIILKLSRKCPLLGRSGSAILLTSSLVSEPITSQS